MIRKTVFGAGFMICGIENQEEIDYSMPLRVMGYDYHDYDKQKRQISRVYRKAWKDKQPDNLETGERLYEFRKTDRLNPVTTFVLFYGDEWDGPRDLRGLTNWTGIPENLWKYFPNYEINIIEIKKLSAKELAMFQKDLRQIFTLIHYADNSEKIIDLLRSDEVYQVVDADVLDVIQEYTGTGTIRELLKRRDEKDLEMRKKYPLAIDNMIAEAAEKASAEAAEKASAEAAERSRLEVLNKLVRDGTISMEKAADIMNMKEEEFAATMEGAFTAEEESAAKKEAFTAEEEFMIK